MCCLLCFALAGLRVLRLARPLAKLVLLVRTMRGLRDLRRVRVARLLADLASLVPTELELRLVCDDCELALRLFARFSFPDLLGVSNSITRFSGSFCLVCVLC